MSRQDDRDGSRQLPTPAEKRSTEGLLHLHDLADELRDQTMLLGYPLYAVILFVFAMLMVAADLGAVMTTVVSVLITAPALFVVAMDVMRRRDLAALERRILDEERRLAARVDHPFSGTGPAGPPPGAPDHTEIGRGRSDLPGRSDGPGPPSGPGATPAAGLLLVALALTAGPLEAQGAGDGTPHVRVTDRMGARVAGDLISPHGANPLLLRRADSVAAIRIESIRLLEIRVPRSRGFGFLRKGAIGGLVGAGTGLVLVPLVSSEPGGGDSSAITTAGGAIIGAIVFGTLGGVVGGVVGLISPGETWSDASLDAVRSPGARYPHTGRGH